MSDVEDAIRRAEELQRAWLEYRTDEAHIASPPTLHEAMAVLEVSAGPVPPRNARRTRRWVVGDLTLRIREADAAFRRYIKEKNR